MTEVGSERGYTHICFVELVRIEAGRTLIRKPTTVQVEFVERLQQYTLHFVHSFSVFCAALGMTGPGVGEGPEPIPLLWGVVLSPGEPWVWGPAPGPPPWMGVFVNESCV